MLCVFIEKKKWRQLGRLWQARRLHRNLEKIAVEPAGRSRQVTLGIGSRGCNKQALPKSKIKPKGAAGTWQGSAKEDEAPATV